MLFADWYYCICNLMMAVDCTGAHLFSRPCLTLILTIHTGGIPQRSCSIVNCLGSTITALQEEVPG